MGDSNRWNATFSRTIFFYFCSKDLPSSDWTGIIGAMKDYIHTGDCLEWLKTLDAECVNCCVTSPPYYGLRDYDVAKQIGREESPEGFISKLVEVFREVKRVLQNDGTLWLNLGDTYCGGGRGGNVQMYSRKKGIPSIPKSIIPYGLKPKDMMGIPWRVAFALQADGWYLRQDIIWAKPNPMPESVTDRCTKSHEYIFLLSKSKQYYYDHEAIKEPVTDTTKTRLGQDNYKNQSGSDRVPGKTNGNMTAVGNSTTRNKRSVWTVNTRGYKEAHFATYPPKLIEPCILAGCPKDGIVLDPFMGAGTTAMVATGLGRHYIGCELNPEYADIARKRIYGPMFSS